MNLVRVLFKSSFRISFHLLFLFFFTLPHHLSIAVFSYHFLLLLSHLLQRASLDNPMNHRNDSSQLFQLDNSRNVTFQMLLYNVVLQFRFTIWFYNLVLQCCFRTSRWPGRLINNRRSLSPITFSVSISCNRICVVTSDNCHRKLFWPQTSRGSWTPFKAPFKASYSNEKNQIESFE